MATYDLAYPGAAIDAILSTAYYLQEAGFIFRGSASDYAGTPSKREWVIAPAGFTGYGISSPVPKGSIGICLYNGTAWVGKIINVVSIDSSVNGSSTNPVSGSAVYSAINQLATGVAEALDNLTFTDTTPSADQDDQIKLKVSTTDAGVERILTYITLLTATTSKAGLMSAEDKAKVDSFLANLRSLTFTDTTASADQGTQITETLKATIGGVQEVIDSITLLRATSSKAGLLSASDKAYIDALPATLTSLSNSISAALALMESLVGYYTCDTAAATAAKTVTATGYSLTNGGCIRIKMTNANTAANVTLNINSTGAKALYYDGTQASSTNTWEAGEVLEVYYDGTQYQCASGGGGKFATGEKVKDVSLLDALDGSENLPKSSAVVDYLSPLNNYIEQLGRRCVQQGETIQQTVYASTGMWNSNTGTINTVYLMRAHIKLLVMGYDHLTVTIPQGYYAQFYYVNDNNISLGSVTGSLDWYVGTKELEINGEHDIMLNIKYGSAGNTNITQEMLANLGWETEKSVSAGYAPAAPYSELATINDVLYGDIEIVPSGAFQQGSNDTSGNIISSTTRLITTNLISIDDNGIVNITANGQKYIILTYSTDGVYETTSGWITEDGEYTFPSAKKVRFLAAKLNNSTITVSELAVVYDITNDIGLIREVENLEEGASDSEVKGNDSFNMFNKRIILYNPYKDKPSHAYKGQLHCHTNNSDGADSPATVVEKYVAAGYDFMTITDHNVITPNPNIEGIVWLGDSYEDTHNSSGYQHMNVFNADAVYGITSMYQSTNTPTTIVNHFVKGGNSIVSYNHPEYPPVYASDVTLENLPVGISFVEVFNGTIQTLLGSVATTDELPTEAYYGDMYDCISDGKRYVNNSITYASPSWQAKTAEQYPEGNLDRGFRIMLDHRHKVFCNAVDDYHRGDNMFNRGWMMVYANSKTKESIWNALLNGCSYASAGVVLTDLNVKDGVISLQIENGENATTTFYGENNTVLATVTGSSASYQIQGAEKYVRAMVQIGRFKAWTQPVWVIDVVNQYEF